MPQSQNHAPVYEKFAINSQAIESDLDYLSKDVN